MLCSVSRSARTCARGRSAGRTGVLRRGGLAQTVAFGVGSTVASATQLRRVGDAERQLHLTIVGSPRHGRMPFVSAPRHTFACAAKDS